MGYKSIPDRRDSIHFFFFFFLPVQLSCLSSNCLGDSCIERAFLPDFYARCRGLFNMLKARDHHNRQEPTPTTVKLGCETPPFPHLGGQCTYSLTLELSKKPRKWTLLC